MDGYVDGYVDSGMEARIENTRMKSRRSFEREQRGNK